MELVVIILIVVVVVVVIIISIIIVTNAKDFCLCVCALEKGSKYHLQKALATEQVLVIADQRVVPVIYIRNKFYQSLSFFVNAYMIRML